MSLLPIARLDALADDVPAHAEADSLSRFTPRDLTSWKRDVAEPVGVSYAGVAR
ncbi:MAG: hypothetical protein H0X35_04290 [Pseudonocardiales bacterium]|nr:hypothetical protein [Pseudonocardiales bacterium]